MWILCPGAGTGFADVVVAQTFELAGWTGVVLVWEEGGESRVVWNQVVARGLASECVWFLQLDGGLAAVLDGGTGLLCDAGKCVHDGAATFYGSHVVCHARRR